MEIGVSSKLLVLVNWFMLLLIMVIMVLLVRFLWRARSKKALNSKKAVPAEAAYNEEEAGAGLGAALRRRRQGCGMTQELVAEQLGVSRQAVSRWEKGEARPSTANIQALAGLYGLSVAELLRENPK